MKKVLSLFLSATLVWTSGSLSQAAALAPEVFVAPSDLPQFRLNPPGKLGRVADYFNAERASARGSEREINKEAEPLVILIQDLHAHYGVQKNIAGLLDFLSDKLPHSRAPSLPFAVAVEGASGPVDSSILALFPDEKIKLQAADYLMRQGELTGSEYFAVQKRLPHLLVGAENESFYVTHRELFRKTLDDRQALVASLKEIQTQVADMPRFVFRTHSALWNFHQKVEAYDRGELSTHEFIGMLVPAATGIDLKKEFPALASFAANSRYGTMDDIRSATASFLTQIQSKLSAEEKKNLQVLAKNQETTNYYLYLRELIYQKQLFLVAPPALAQYLEYLHAAQTMGMDRVTHEAKELAFRIKLQLAQEPSAGASERASGSTKQDSDSHAPALPRSPAQDLVQVQHDLDLLLRLADLQATEFEVRDFAPRLNQFVALTKSLIPPSSFEETKIRRLISSSIDFYVMALVRNKPMIENTLQLIAASDLSGGEPRKAGIPKRRRKVAHLKNRFLSPTSRLSRRSGIPAPQETRPLPNVAVLIAGGFHTVQLTNLLREKNISYLVLSPSVDSISDADRELYVKRLKGDHLTVEQVLADSQAGLDPKSKSLAPDFLAHLWPSRKSSPATLSTGLDYPGRVLLGAAAIVGVWMAAHHFPFDSAHLPQLAAAVKGSLWSSLPEAAAIVKGHLGHIVIGVSTAIGAGVHLAASASQPTFVKVNLLLDGQLEEIAKSRGKNLSLHVSRFSDIPKTLPDGLKAVLTDDAIFRPFVKVYLNGELVQRGEDPVLSETDVISFRPIQREGSGHWTSARLGAQSAEIQHQNDFNRKQAAKDFHRIDATLQRVFAYLDAGWVELASVSADPQKEVTVRVRRQAALAEGFAKLSGYASLGELLWLSGQLEHPFPMKALDTPTFGSIIQSMMIGASSQEEFDGYRQNPKGYLLLRQVHHEIETYLGYYTEALTPRNAEDPPFQFYADRKRGPLTSPFLLRSRSPLRLAQFKNGGAEAIPQQPTPSATIPFLGQVYPRSSNTPTHLSLKEEALTGTAWVVGETEAMKIHRTPQGNVFYQIFHIRPEGFFADQPIMIEAKIEDGQYHLRLPLGDRAYSKITIYPKEGERAYFYLSAGVSDSNQRPQSISVWGSSSNEDLFQTHPIWGIAAEHNMTISAGPSAEVRGRIYTQEDDNRYIADHLPAELRDNPQALDQFPLASRGNYSVRVIPIVGLLENRKLLGQIGLGRYYGQPVFYIDAQYASDETVLAHELYTIEQWDQKRESLGLAWSGMRAWILTNLDEAKAFEKDVHDSAPSIDHLLGEDALERLQDPNNLTSGAGPGSNVSLFRQWIDYLKADQDLANRSPVYNAIGAGAIALGMLRYAQGNEVTLHDLEFLKGLFNVNLNPFIRSIHSRLSQINPGARSIRDELNSILPNLYVDAARYAADQEVIKEYSLAGFQNELKPMLMELPSNGKPLSQLSPEERRAYFVDDRAAVLSPEIAEMLAASALDFETFMTALESELIRRRANSYVKSLINKTVGDKTDENVLFIIGLRRAIWNNTLRDFLATHRAFVDKFMDNLGLAREQLRAFTKEWTSGEAGRGLESHLPANKHSAAFGIVEFIESAAKARQHSIPQHKSFSFSGLNTAQRKSIEERFKTRFGRPFGDAELRILSEHSNDPTFLENFLNDVERHTFWMEVDLDQRGGWLAITAMPSYVIVWPFVHGLPDNLQLPLAEHYANKMERAVKPGEPKQITVGREKSDMTLMGSEIIFPKDLFPSMSAQQLHLIWDGSKWSITDIGTNESRDLAPFAAQRKRWMTLKSKESYSLDPAYWDRWDAWKAAKGDGSSTSTTSATNYSGAVPLFFAFLAVKHPLAAGALAFAYTVTHWTLPGLGKTLLDLFHRPGHFVHEKLGHGLAAKWLNLPIEYISTGIDAQTRIENQDEFLLNTVGAERDRWLRNFRNLSLAGLVANGIVGIAAFGLTLVSLTNPLLSAILFILFASNAKEFARSLFIKRDWAQAFHFNALRKKKSITPEDLRSIADLWRFDSPTAQTEPTTGTSALLKQIIKTLLTNHGRTGINSLDADPAHALAILSILQRFAGQVLINLKPKTEIRRAGKGKEFLANPLDFEIQKTLDQWFKELDDPVFKNLYLDLSKPDQEEARKEQLKAIGALVKQLIEAALEKPEFAKLNTSYTEVGTANRETQVVANFADSQKLVGNRSNELRTSIEEGAKQFYPQWLTVLKAKFAASDDNLLNKYLDFAKKAISKAEGIQEGSIVKATLFGANPTRWVVEQTTLIPTEQNILEALLIDIGMPPAARIVPGAGNNTTLLRGHFANFTAIPKKNIEALRALALNTIGNHNADRTLVDEMSDELLAIYKGSRDEKLKNTAVIHVTDNTDRRDDILNRILERAQTSGPVTGEKLKDAAKSAGLLHAEKVLLDLEGKTKPGTAPQGPAPVSLEKGDVVAILNEFEGLLERQGHDISQITEESFATALRAFAKAQNGQFMGLALGNPARAAEVFLEKSNYGLQLQGKPLLETAPAVTPASISGASVFAYPEFPEDLEIYIGDLIRASNSKAILAAHAAFLIRMGPQIPALRGPFSRQSEARKAIRTFVKSVYIPMLTAKFADNLEAEVKAGKFGSDREAYYMKRYGPPESLSLPTGGMGLPFEWYRPLAATAEWLLALLAPAAVIAIGHPSGALESAAAVIVSSSFAPLGLLVLHALFNRSVLRGFNGVGVRAMLNDSAAVAMAGAVGLVGFTSGLPIVMVLGGLTTVALSVPLLLKHTQLNFGGVYALQNNATTHESFLDTVRNWLATRHLWMTHRIFNQTIGLISNSNAHVAALAGHPATAGDLDPKDLDTLMPGSDRSPVEVQRRSLIEIIRTAA